MHKENQTNEKKANYTIPWLLLSIIANIKVKESAGWDLEAEQSSAVDQSLAFICKAAQKRKSYSGATESTCKTSGHQEINMEEGQIHETMETRGYTGKELFHFVDLYHQLPEELLLTWLMRATKGCVFGFAAAAWKSMFGLVQDPQLTMEKSQTAVHDPDT